MVWLFTISPEFRIGGVVKVEVYWWSWFGFFLLLLLSLTYSCQLKLVGDGENESGLIGEGVEEEKKAVRLGLV
ncbi:hypothetical protein KY290_005334 [Solanum tuberosum]|uniref:Uncharacterized protein n=1 Tax=Solanum tuberosum TaxID=4113 RepID=A0ABQ7WG97_SOLTU|nr:hypothetical protein KY289_005723 [Solanum tuberosum]KAH0778907.1 hypothetical protein KY290_005334 [Solanum tuberosum]